MPAPNDLLFTGFKPHGSKTKRKIGIRMKYFHDNACMFVKKVNDYVASTLLMCEVLNVYVYSVLKDFSPVVRGIFLGMTEMIAFSQFAILFRRSVQT